MSTQSISSRLSNLQRQYRNRPSHHRLGIKRTRRSIAAPESLECRRLLATDFGLGAADHPGDEPFPDTFTVTGVKWDDVNANGRRDQGEPGLADVTIYSDLNRNGRLDDDEPWTTTSDEVGPDGVVRSGFYELSGLDPGAHFIREVVPEGAIQTFPSSIGPIFQAGDGQEDPFATVQPEELRIDGVGPLSTEVALTIHPFCFVPIEVDVRGSHPGLLVFNEDGPRLNSCGGDTSVFEVTILNLSPRNANSAIEFVDLSGDQTIATIPLVGRGSGGGAHVVEGFPGEFIGGINFGNHREQPLASVHGHKWLDRDGDGQRDEDEPGISGVTIFADSNGNHRHDFFEPSTITMDDGMYWLDGLRPGDHVIREVVPDGFRQTFPGLNVHVGDTELGRYHPGVAFDLFPGGGEARSAGGAIDLALDVTVVWPDSCGTLDVEETSQTVVGDHILLELHGHQEGDACAEVISPETTTVKIDDLQQREYTVVATLHEELRDGGDVPTLAAVSSVTIGRRSGHRVELGPGESIDGINFGNQPLPPGQIHGTKWLDKNGNGRRDEGEPGVAGIMIFSDTNLNGQLDDDEPQAITMEDNPETSVDEGGRYWLEELKPGQHWVKEILPDGFVQTFPGPDGIGPPFPIPGIGFPIGPDGQPIGQDGVPIDLNGVAPEDGNLPFDLWIPPFPGGGHWLFLGGGETVEGIDFGNRESVPGSVHGVKWLDENGNRVRDDGERGLPGVTIYSDLNQNEQFDDGEPHAVTMEDFNDDLIDDNGKYWLEGLEPGIHYIREVVPDGFVQTFPEALPRPVPFGQDGNIDPNLPLGDSAHVVFIRGDGTVIEGLNFGNRVFEPAQIHGIKWHDLNGNGQRENNEPGLPGVTIYVDLNFNRMFDADEPHAETMEDGRYWIEGLDPGGHVVREVVPDGFVQTFPPPFFFGQQPFGENGIPFPDSDGGHFVFLEVGDVREGIDFGNREVGSSSIHGRKWRDDNGNGRQDDREPGLAGVIIYIDANENGVLDEGERRTITMEEDLETDFDEAGMYWLDDLEPGRHVVREVVPDGFEQTFPRGGGVDVIHVFSAPIQPLVVHEFSLGPTAGNVGPSDLTFFITMGACARFHPDETEFEIVGRHISVNLFVDSANHEVACDAGIETVTQTIDLGPLESGDYELRALLSEIATDGELVESFVLEATLLVESSNAHVVHLEPGRGVDGVNFGNRPTDRTAIHGTKWLDHNGNSKRDPDEPGLGGVTIYVDINDNGRFDDDDPHATTNDDGRYSIVGFEPGLYDVREVVPHGFVQTFPHPEEGGAHTLKVEPGRVFDGIDFGNQRTDVEFASIHGVKWLDENGNGSREFGERGLGGVLIYLDLNWNERFDEGEPHAETMHGDDATNTAAGTYSMDGIEPGFYLVREVVPEGFEQTFPEVLLCEAVFCSGRAHIVNLEPGQTIDGLNFGNQPVEAELGALHGRKWLDRNGNGRREDDEPGMPGIPILLTGADGKVRDTRTMEDDPSTPHDESGVYWFDEVEPGMYSVTELVPDGFRQTFPGHAEICFVLDLLPGSPFCQGPEHLVSVGPGEVIDGLDFGNAPAEVEFASVHGTKWLDRNGDGERQDGEPGLPGVTIYSDINLNGRFDPHEPHARTMRDNPNTDFDESGMYWIEGLRPGDHLIEEVVPDGFEKTFPISFSAAPWPISEPYFMFLEPGQVFDHADFGNHPMEGGGMVVGVKWLDRDGDGKRDDVEQGLGGITIFADADNDGMLGPHEISTVTSFDNPATFLDEAGRYQLNLPVGEHRITELVPDGFVATFPIGSAVGETFSIPRVPFRARGYDLTDVETVEVGADGVAVELTFATIWPDGCGSVVDDASGFEIDDSGRIHVEMLGNQGDFFCPQVITTDSASIVVPGLAPGEHHVRAELHEQTFEGTTRLSWVVEAVVTVGAAGAHVVELHDGDVVEGVNFGNQRTMQSNEMIWDGAAPVGASGDGSNWDDERNWSLNGEADAHPETNELGADVVFGRGRGGLVNLGRNQERIVHSLHFMDDYVLVGDDVRLDVTSGDLVVDGGFSASINAFVHSSSGELRKSGGGTLTLLDGGDAVTVIEGVLRGSSHIHQLSVGSMGTVAPGASAGTMEVGSAILDSGATLEIEIGDSNHDRFLAESTVFLAGQLAVELMDGFTVPTRGTSQMLSIVESSIVEGRFDEPTFEQRHLGHGVFYDVVYRPSSVELSLLSANPGDANGDGHVDGIDLTIWSGNRFGEGDWTQGDFTGDGLVDGSDFDLWNQFRFTGTELALAPKLPLAGSNPRAALNEQVAIVSELASEAARTLRKSSLSVDARPALDSAASETAQRNAAANPRGDWVSRKTRRLGDHSAMASVDSANATENWEDLADEVFAKLGAR